MTLMRQKPKPVTHGVPPWYGVAGFLVGALTLLFFMGIVALSLRGVPVPCSAHFSIAVVLALGTGLSAHFMGGSALARGKLGFLKGIVTPLNFSVTGGVAVLLVVFLIARQAYPDCEDRVVTVSGKVFDEGGAAIPNVIIGFRESSLETHTNADGAFSLRSPVSSGKVHLRASKRGLITREVLIDMPNQGIELTLERDPKGALTDRPQLEVTITSARVGREAIVQAHITNPADQAISFKELRIVGAVSQTVNGSGEFTNVVEYRLALQNTVSAGLQGKAVVDGGKPYQAVGTYKEVFDTRVGKNVQKYEIEVRAPFPLRIPASDQAIVNIVLDRLSILKRVGMRSQGGIGASYGDIGRAFEFQFVATRGDTLRWQTQDDRILSWIQYSVIDTLPDNKPAF